MLLSGGTITGLVRTVWLAGYMTNGFWFDADAPAVAPRVVTPSSTEEVQIQDRVYRRDTGQVSVTDFLWPYTIPARGISGTVTRSTSNAAVIIPDPDDVSRWIWQGNGEATITLAAAGSRTINATVTASTGAESPVETFLRYASDSLRASAISAVDSRLAGKSPATALRLYSTQDHATPAYVRSVNCWAAGLDLTSISPWNSSSGAALGITLVSPRHVLMAAHATIGTGSTVRFVTAGNAVVERTISATQAVSGYAPYYPDLAVGLLNADVPATISFARVLPAAWASKLPSVSGVPVLCLDGEEKAIVSDLWSISANAGTYGAMANVQPPADAVRLTFHEDKVGGDSGNPAGLVVNGNFVLLTVWTFGGYGAGTSIAYHINGLNAAMTALGGGYQLTEADLSGFATY